jgi:hypothetical protein
VRANPPCVASAGLLLLVMSATPAQALPGQRSPQPRHPAPRPVPAYTDDDLARYREERLRRESTTAEPAPPTTAGESVPAANPTAPAPRPAVSVELKDLNRTLPPEARTAAEAAGRRFVTFFGVPVEGPLVIPLRYFPVAAAFKDHLARNVPYDVNWTGYYDPLKREIVVGNSDNYVAVLLHEINHFIFDTTFDEAPVWLREGLAEYFETASTSPDGLVVRDQPRHRRQLAEWLRTTRQPDLRQLLALNRSMWRDHELEDSRRVRALSWSIVDFLMSSPGGRKTLQEFMATLKNQRGLYSLEAFNRTFPGGAAAFERQWLEHVQARSRAGGSAPKPQGDRR